ncbi:MAG: putative baseplate assembly protein [Gammaproteobacteria bacterium]
MSRAWWGREAIGAQIPDRVLPPKLRPDGRDAVESEVIARISDFTLQWQPREDDAGLALVGLHAELAEPVVERVNQLPQKSLREFLRVADVAPTPPRPARAMLTFTVSDTAPGSATIPKYFQVSAAPADGSSGRVVFETEQVLYAAPGEIATVAVQQGSAFTTIELGEPGSGVSVPALGDSPRSGAALLLGLSSAVAPGPNITLAVELAGVAGAPSPVALGGIGTANAAPQPTLRWAFLDGAAFEPAEVIRDDTRNLTQSGIVELRCPRQWRTGTPDGMAAEIPLRWLRVQLVAGAFATAPLLSFVQLNAVTAIAATTIRDEVLEYVPGTDGRRLRLSQRPILASSLELRIDEGTISGDLASRNTRVLWQQVTDLNASGPDDRVYELDATSGEVQSGDGVRGKRFPRGFRHIVAEQYQLATGAAGAVDADEITSLISSARFVTGVTNPLPAFGGRDAEPIADTVRRGPQVVRARNRAVAVADYNLLAVTAPGADVIRAHAVPGFHAGFGNAEVPGAVTVFLIGPGKPEGPPYPEEGSLDAVARFLTESATPAGTEVVAAATRFMNVSVRASLIVAHGADGSDVLRKALREFDAYFDPAFGGPDRRGWPFGATIQHTALVERVVSRVPNLIGIDALNITLDGFTHKACADVPLRPHSLLWPEPHELRIVEGGGE